MNANYKADYEADVKVAFNADGTCRLCPENENDPPLRYLTLEAKKNHCKSRHSCPKCRRHFADEMMENHLRECSSPPPKPDRLRIILNPMDEQSPQPSANAPNVRVHEHKDGNIFDL